MMQSLRLQRLVSSIPRQHPLSARYLPSSSLSNRSNNDNYFHLSYNNNHAVSYLSTTPQQEQKQVLFEVPSNLKFDPRVKASPVYGAELINKKKSKKKEATAVSPSAESTEEAAAVREDEEQFDQDDDVEDDIDDDRMIYNLSTKPQAKLSIPLPQRLHVNIMDLKTADEIGSIHLSPHTFGMDPVRVDILHRCVVYQRNKKRGKRNAGARTKTISEVSGSGRKVRQQKGSGKARAGHSRPAHWRGGAKAHGPKGAVQDYTTKLNKKVRNMGVRHVLSQKLLEGNLVVLGDMALENHKTRRLEEILKRFGVGKFGSSALFLDDATDDNDEDDDGGTKKESMVYGGLNINFKVACGNLPKIKVLNQKGCNVYSVLKYEKLFVSLGALKALEERLEKKL
eukprot:scaffold95012_cov59-Cyclotella_meneghiniana.AAC.6